MLSLGNISKDVLANNMKKKKRKKMKKKKQKATTTTTGLNRYVYNFSVDQRAFDIKDITTIHKYLMEKHDIN